MTVAPGDGERAIAEFVARELGGEATRVVRVDAFASNAVYEVDADGRRFVVKASTMHDALRAEAWSCARGAEAGCPAPAILAFGRLGTHPDTSALVMSRVAGRPIGAGHPALSEVGVVLRRLHEVKPAGFGWLAGASWDDRGVCSLEHDSWPAFLAGILRDARGLVQDHPVAARVADSAAAALDAHADAFAAVEAGSLCHGDLKAAHVLVEAGRIAGVIDWGDAVVGDPVWDIARFADRLDAGSISRLLEGYDPDPATVRDLAWRIPLYGGLWMLVDAIVDHRLGHCPEAALRAAAGYLVGS